MKAGDLKKYVPYILTAATCIGVVVTGYFSGTTAIKANDEIKEKDLHFKDAEKEEKVEYVKTVTKAMWPAFVAEAATISVAIINHNLVATTASAAVGAAAMTSRLATHYQNEILERHGREELEDIDRKFATDYELGVVEAATPRIYSDNFIMEICDPVMENDHLFFDELSCRWFRASGFAVKNAMYHTNRNFILGGAPTLAEFYSFIGLPDDGHSDEYENIGWGDEFLESGMAWIDFRLTEAKLQETGELYYIISYPCVPDVMDDSFEYAHPSDWTPASYT